MLKKVIFGARAESFAIIYAPDQNVKKTIAACNRHNILHLFLAYAKTTTFHTVYDSSVTSDLLPIQQIAIVRYVIIIRTRCDVTFSDTCTHIPIEA